MIQECFEAEYQINTFTSIDSVELAAPSFDVPSKDGSIYKYMNDIFCFTYINKVKIHENPKFNKNVP